jgi:uncharacterized protein YndB with AHSA1/START domain
MTTPNVPHRFELELTVDATPEQVWRAIASAEGISAWMMPTELDPREGGLVKFDMGPEMSSIGKVTAFEPTRRLAYEEDWASLAGHPTDGVTPLLTEFLVEAKSGGTCIVRVVTSAYGSGADWENEFWSGMTSGWAPILDNLRVYLGHFADQASTSVSATTTVAGTSEDAVGRVAAALGVGAVGDAVDSHGFVGTVERVIHEHFLLRLERPAPALVTCFSWGAEGAVSITLSAYLYGAEGAEQAETVQTSLQACLDELTRDQAVAAAS